VGHPDLRRRDIGLAEDRFSQQQDAGEEKEKRYQAEVVRDADMAKLLGTTSVCRMGWVAASGLRH
jgi:hypothetical protein